MKSLRTVLSKTELAALGMFVEGLRGSLAGKLETVVLFGSKARGTATKTSDTDVAVVILGRKSPAVRFAIAEPAFKPMAQYGVDISPLLFTASEFRGRSPLSETIRKEGIPLWSKRRNWLNAA